MRAQVVQEPRVVEGGDGGALEQVAGLPGVQGKRGGAGGQREPGGEPAEELGCGDGAAALGPGRFAGEGGGFDREPVQGKEPWSSGEYRRDSASESPSRLLGSGWRG